MKYPILLSLIFGTTTLWAADPPPDRAALIVATGAKGEEAYAAPFAQWAANWKRAGETAGAQLIAIPPDQPTAREELRKAIDAQAKESSAALWIVLLGHGSFDGREGKFNLPGDDLAVSDLVDWLKPFQRPVVIVCGFSASGAFLKPLSAPGRIIVAATRSGAENNYARLGGYLSETIASPEADLDKDGQTSLLEAWLAAAQRTAEFYKGEERLPTEHSLLDDNGDGLGTPADWFRGIRVVKKSSDKRAPDGLRAHQIHLISSPAEKAWSPAARAERDKLELDLARLRDHKPTPPDDAYYTQLEALLLRLAHLYREGGATQPE